MSCTAVGSAGMPSSMAAAEIRRASETSRRDRRHGDAGVAQVDVEVLLLGAAGEPADLVDERDALGQRAGPEVGRDQVVEAAPVLDTVGRVELPGSDLHRHGWRT